MLFQTMFALWVLPAMPARLSPEHREEIHPIEQKCVARRQAIRDCKITVNCRIGKGNRALEAPHFLQVGTLWIAPGGMRLDWRKSDGEREVLCQHDGVSFWMDTAKKNGKEVLATRSSLAPTGNRAARKILNPRLLGLEVQTTPNLIHEKVGGFVGRSDRKWTRTSHMAREGAPPLLLVELETVSGALQKMWFDEQRDGALVRAEISKLEKGAVFKNTLECELAMVAGFGWFPAEIHITHRRGDEVTVEEKSTIAVAAINQGVDGAEFTLAGINPPTGKHIYDMTSARDPQELVWNGTQAVPYVIEMDSFDYKRFVTKENQRREVEGHWIGRLTDGSGYGRAMLIGAGLLFAIVAAYLFRRAIMIKRRS